jgi:hypothetical protein
MKTLFRKRTKTFKETTNYYDYEQTFLKKNAKDVAHIRDTVKRVMSPAMKEYVSQKNYHKEVEQKKTVNLANFFIEKYVLVTKLMRDEKVEGNDRNSELLQDLSTCPLSKHSTRKQKSK